MIWGVQRWARKARAFRRKIVPPFEKKYPASQSFQHPTAIPYYCPCRKTLPAMDAVEYIREVITRFGGRYFGSEQEKQAQLYTKEVLEQYCTTTAIVPFDSALEAHFQSLKLFCVVYAITLVVFPFSMPAAAVIAVVNTVLFLGHFVTYRHWLDFLYKQKTSYNVVGDIPPTGTPKRTIIFAGHIDSVKEFKWWYRLKQSGAVLSVVAGLLFPIMAMFMVVAATVGGPWTLYGWYALIAASPILIVYFDMHGTEVVHGALDNLTGVAMAVEMAKVFAADRPAHTHIRCISFGAEESGLRGAWAYAKANKEQLLAEHALLINIDTIKDVEFLTIGTRETNTLVRFDKELVAGMVRSFDAMNVAVKQLPFDVGASDASAFRILGLPALCIIGMRTDTLDPCYHTRLDNLSHLNGAAMEKLKGVLVHYVKALDQA